MKKLFCSPLAGVALLLSVQMQAASFAADKKLEIFSYWSSGGEAAALDALFQATKRADPGIEIVNATVAGGGGSTAQPVLQARLAGGNPPDSWQIHPGWELLSGYVQANYCEPITDLYKSEGWDNVVPKDLIDMLTKNGQTYAVLVGVHRGNDLWYNKKVLEKNGIKVGDKMTFAEFFAAAEKLKAAGVTPLAVGDLPESGRLPSSLKTRCSGRLDPRVGQISSQARWLGTTRRLNGRPRFTEKCLPTRMPITQLCFGIRL